MKKENHTEVEIDFNGTGRAITMSQERWDKMVMEEVYRVVVKKLAKREDITFEHATITESNGDVHQVNYYN